MKFYRVIYSSIYVEGGEKLVTVKTFKNKELAQKYIRREIERAKQDVDTDDLENYCVEENEYYYERYLEGYASEDCVEIWLEEDEFYDDIEIKLESEEVENDYEI